MIFVVLICDLCNEGFHGDGILVDGALEFCTILGGVCSQTRDDVCEKETGVFQASCLAAIKMVGINGRDDVFCVCINHMCIFWVAMMTWFCVWVCCEPSPFGCFVLCFETFIG